MRPSDLPNVEPIAFVIADSIRRYEEIPSDDITLIEKTLRDQFRRAKREVKDLQREQYRNNHGYILYLDEVYKVFFNNNDVEKIRGEEAKTAKRTIKQRTH